MHRKLVILVLAVSATLLALAPAAGACGFLVAESGAVRLVRTSTFVAWDGEVERYITNFEFASPESSFGSIIPLPAEPTHVGKAGSWTLQRLDREVRGTDEQLLDAAGDGFETASSVEIVLETRVDSLDITVVKGGGSDVADWADEQGFDLGEGSAELLDFYGDRSPYFLAARFDAPAAVDDGLVSGDGIPILIEVPVERPWVPLHILGFDRAPEDRIEADVFLLTPDRPDLLHGVGLTVNRSERAGSLLLDDLRSDENMEWVPEEGWFTHLELDAAAGDLTYDLSVGTADVEPSFVASGFAQFEPSQDQLEAFGLRSSGGPGWWPVALLAAGLGVVGGLVGAVAVGLVAAPAPTPTRGERP